MLTLRIGADHARMRKIMSPAFTASQLKSFLPLFRGTAQKVGHRICIARVVSPLARLPLPILAYSLDRNGRTSFNKKVLLECGLTSMRGSHGARWT